MTKARLFFRNAAQLDENNDDVEGPPPKRAAVEDSHAEVAQGI